VRAPAQLCFELWDDWNRLVDFLDLISQVCIMAGALRCGCGVRGATVR
jgi:hypothetical protein